MALPSNVRHAPLAVAPLALALAAALAATACQREASDAAPAAPDSAPTASMAEPATDAAATPAPGPSAPVAYDCGGTAVQASFDGNNATVRIDGESIPLSTVPAASGARYQGTRADGVAVELWVKGGSATLSVAGNAYPECTSAAPADAAAATTAAATYRARGNEPFWTVEISNGELRWSTMDAPEPVVFSVNQPAADAGSFTISIASVSSDADAQSLSMAAERGICRDSMSGMPYPHTVTVRVGEQEYRGCGGDAAALLSENEWTVTSVGGSAAGERPPTLQFMADGGAAGFAGCNRWMSPAKLTGEGLSFERAASTMMACPEEAMKAERDFLDALAKVTRHDFDDAGNLLLKAGDETIIVAAKAAPAEAAPDETPAG
jgi:heat shock protein HslJ/membrane-bound inhibitor of C-type lysozyme